MKIWQGFLAGAGFIALAHGAAQAGALTVFNVSAPKINCVFNASCTIVVNDSVANMTYALFGTGAFLQSRTYPGQPNTPAAGATGYEYRVDFSSADKYADCIAGIVVNFGPALMLPYGPNNAKGHVFVTTQGGIGSVGIKSAEEDGNVITFWFDKYLCPGASTYFFGLAAAKAPENSSATLFGYGPTPFTQLTARVPQH